MKHLDLRFYWLRDEVEKGSIRLEHIGTDEMPADLLTKSLARVKMQKFAEMMGLRARGLPRREGVLVFGMVR